MQNNYLKIFRKKVSSSYDLVTTAYHESGHVICALLHNIKVESVTLNQKDKEARVYGLTEYYPFWSETTDPYIFYYGLIGEIKVYYAGLVAEKLFYKKISGSDKFPSFLKDGSSEDTKNSANLIKKFCLANPGRKRLAYKKKITKQVIKLLEDYWEDVTLISHSLFSKKKLNYENIKNILTKKSANKLFWKQKFKDIGSYFQYDIDCLDEDNLRHILKQ